MFFFFFLGGYLEGTVIKIIIIFQSVDAIQYYNKPVINMLPLHSLDSEEAL
jgi:hypothetical protein